MGIDMVTADDGWIVGRNGEILHLENGSWVQVESPTVQGLYDIQMLSRSEGWAVGFEILKYEEGAWALQQKPPLPPPWDWHLHWLQAVNMQSADSGWSAGQGPLILRYGPGTSLSGGSGGTVFVPAVSD
jgi:hypothetical protein